MPSVMAEAVELDSVSRGVRSMFFMLTPNESSFQKVEDVPQYVQQVGTASLSLTSSNNTADVMIYRERSQTSSPPLSVSETPQMTFIFIWKKKLRASAAVKVVKSQKKHTSCQFKGL